MHKETWKLYGVVIGVYFCVIHHAFESKVESLIEKSEMVVKRQRVKKGGRVTGIEG